MRKFLAALITVSCVFAASKVAAIDCGQCKEDYIGGVQSHWFGSGGPPHPFECGPAGCHSETATFFCDTHGHNSCSEFAALPFGALNLALESNDILLLGAFATLAPKAVVYNAKRSSIQVMNCKGEVVANIPLSQNSLFSLS